MARWSLLSLFWLLVLSAPAWSATLRVPLDYPTIQAGIDAAITGDEILVSPGVYFGPGNASFDFVGKSVVVRSEAGREATVIMIVAPGVLFHSAETRAARLEGFTLDAGSQTRALSTDHASPTIADCVIQNGYTFQSDGGGVHCEWGAPRFEGTEFRDCRALEASGGALASNESALEMVACHVHDCEATRGGGLHFYAGISLVSDSVIERNQAHGGGGGGGISAVSAQIVGCTLRGNKAWIGGGFAGGGDLIRCVITGNEARRPPGEPGLSVGGGAYAAGWSIQECTITGNHATSGGGGVFCEGEAIFRSILWGNCPVGELSDLYGQGYVTLECCAFGQGRLLKGNPPVFIGPQVLEDPLFCNPAACGLGTEGEYDLRSDSPCLAEVSPCGARIGALGVGCNAAAVPPTVLTTKRLFNSEPSPNPIRNVTRWLIGLTGPASVTTRWIDSSGRIVAEISNGWFEPGVHSLEGTPRDSDGVNLPAGAYWLEIQAGEQRDARPVVVLP